MSRNSRNQSDHQEALAIHIAAGGKVSGFANDRAIPLRTVQRWATEPRLIERVNELRHIATDEAVGLLSQSSRAAVLTLRQLTLAGDSHGVRLSAARTILSLLIELRTYHENEARLRAIEAKFAILGG